VAQYILCLIAQIYAKIHSSGLALKCLSWESFSPNDSKKWLSIPDVSNWMGQQLPHVLQYTTHNVNIPFMSTTQIFMAFSMVAMSTHAATQLLNHAVSSQDSSIAENSSCWHETLHWSFQDLFFPAASCFMLSTAFELVFQDTRRMQMSCLKGNRNPSQLLITSVFTETYFLR
jgi:hypothetical protein